ncbi:hypothetical protein DDU33_05165 [Actinobacillus porcitonsillarum]|uniref:Adhesin n=1 Tax=Actinobacillus porcitonsillarum TaxID=189834 RepID=A0A2U8FK70_9PAST|nr:YadA-like family protein [Actinobacillus porcitonsillarum]AWI50906.1 hypothetical protein DDU33_05165 [Actinobacillus porcitonsillarum]
MNKIFKVIWNHATQSFVVVSELTRTKGKSASTTDNRVEPSKALLALGVAGAALIGGNAQAVTLGTSVSDGSYTRTNDGSVAIGYNAVTQNHSSVAIGTNVAAAADSSVAIGLNARTLQENGVAVGADAKAYSQSSTAISMKAQAFGNNTLAAGFDAYANTVESNSATDTAVDGQLTADGVEVWYDSQGNTRYSNVPALALGAESSATNRNAIAIGTLSNASGNRAMAMGAGANASGMRAIANGWRSNASGERALAIGPESKSSAKDAIAIGNTTNVSGNYSVALGANANVKNQNTFVFGSNLTTTQDNSVVLGQGSTDRAATTETSTTLLGVTYGTFAGQGSAANGIVSVGAVGKERQIINVAAGNISATSTDAINGSQLYLVAVEAAKKAVVTSKDNTVNVTVTTDATTGVTTYDLSVPASTATGGTTDTSTYFHVNNGSNTGKGDATTNLGDITSAAGATGTAALAAGENTTAKGNYASAVGYNTTASGDASVAMGNSTSITNATNSVAIGNASVIANGTDSIAIGNNATIGAGTTVDYAIAIGTNTTAGTKSISMGLNATSTTEAVAIGPETKAYACATVIGYNSTSQTRGVAIGMDSVACATSVAIGYSTETREGSTAIGFDASAIGQSSVAIGYTVSANGSESVAVGNASSSNGGLATALGSYSNATANESVAIGARSNASSNAANSVAIGPYATTNASMAIAIGQQAKGLAANATAIGQGAAANASDAISIGTNAGILPGTGAVSGDSSIAVGRSSLAQGERAVALGRTATANGTRSSALGAGAVTEADYGVALGNRAQVNTGATNGVALGNTSITSAENATSIGAAATASHAGAVALGNGSTTRAATSENSATVGPLTYSGFAGTSPASVVSVGSAGAERQLVNVAAGNISATSTDAINGSQLYAVAAEVAKGYNVTSNGGTNVTLLPGAQTNFLAEGLATVSHKANTTTGGVDVTYNVAKGSFDTTTDGTVVPNTTTPGVVTADDVAKAVNSGFWKVGNGAVVNNVTFGDEVHFIAGANTTVTVTKVDDNNTTIAYDVDLSKVNLPDVSNTTLTMADNGTVAAPTDGDKLVNATTVANAINNAAFNVTIASDATEFTDQDGKANASVKAGSELVLKSGKNLIAKQEGTNITFATKEEVDFNKVTLSNGTTGGVNLVNEAAQPATNNADAPTSALNITSTDGKPTQITGVGSTLNTTTVATAPNGSADGTKPNTVNLVDLANATNPNSAATVGDLQNMGWVVSAAGNNYTDAVKNANEVKFVGKDGVTVTGNTDGNVREITVAVNKAPIQANGTNITTYAAGDVVNYANGNGTTAQVTPITDANGNTTGYNVTFDVNTTTLGDNTTPNGVNANGTVAAPANGDSFLNASTVVNAINNAAFNVTIEADKTTFADLAGKDNAQVKAGSELVLKSGKNLVVKQDNTNITFATADDVTFNNVTSNNLTLNNGGTNAVNLTNEKGVAANNTATGNPIDNQSALNITDTAGNPTQITGVGSSLNTTTVDTAPTGTGSANSTTFIDLALTPNGTTTLPDNILNSAATVRDLANMGWIVSAAGNSYKDGVKNANEVKFIGDGVNVTGETKDGVREITIAVNKGSVESNTTTGLANGTTNFVTGDQVANAINNSGWTTTPTTVIDADGNKVENPTAEVINPGDAVNYVNGNGTTANVTVVKGKDGQPDTFNVSYDVNTTTLGDDTTPNGVNANGTVAAPVDGDSFLNASTVVNAINNAAFNVTIASDKTAFTDQDGKEDAQVKAGSELVLKSGKNLIAKQEGTNITFATADDVTFNNVTSNNLTLNNGGTNAVNLTNEKGIAANNTASGSPIDNQSALNITDTAGNPTQITGVGSSLNTTTVTTAPEGTGSTGSDKLVDLGSKDAPLAENVLNSAATVRDLANMGWVVGVQDNEYVDTVKNANKVEFIGGNGVDIAGKTNATTGVREITIAVETGNVTSNSTTGSATGSGNFVTGGQVADAINNSGWTTTPTTVIDADGNKVENPTAEVINPGDAVNYVNGNGTTANVTVVKGKDGQPDTFNVSYDVNTTTLGDDTTPNGVNANGTVAAPVDGDSFLNASTVVNAINNAAFNVTIGSDTATFADQDGKANAQVKAGSELVLKSGKNLIAKQEGTNITFATADDVTFNNVTSNNLTLNNGGTNAVNLTNEKGIAANNTASGSPIDNQSALNITDTAGNPTQITGVGSSLNTTTVTTAPEGTGSTGSDKLVDLGSKDAPLAENVLNSAATVRDLANMGWVVGVQDNEYVDTVKNANKVEFIGGNGIDIAGKTNATTGVREISVEIDKGSVKANTTTGVAEGDIAPNKVATTADVINTINNTGWTTTPTTVIDANGNKVENPTAEVINPGDTVNYVNGNGTTANVTVVKGKDGQPDTFNVSYDVNTANPTVANSNGSIAAPTGTDGANYVNATTLVDTVNKASWNVNASKVEGSTGQSTYEAGDKVKAGDTVTINAGNNIVVSGSGKTINVATSMTPTFETVQVGGSTGPVISGDTNGDVKVAKKDGSAAKITNVAAGTADTDAVNYSQLKQAAGDIHNKINRNNKDLRAGIAGANAAAGLPQVYIPGKSMVAAAAGTFKGQSAVAVGYSRASDNGKLILKLQGNANTRGDIGGSVGVGYQW